MNMQSSISDLYLNSLRAYPIFPLTTKNTSDSTTYSFLLYLEGFWYFSSPWPCIRYCKFLIDNWSINQNHCSIPTTTLLVSTKSIRTNMTTCFLSAALMACAGNVWLLTVIIKWYPFLAATMLTFIITAAVSIYRRECDWAQHAAD